MARPGVSRKFHANRKIKKAGGMSREGPSAIALDADGRQA